MKKFTIIIICLLFQSNAWSLAGIGLKGVIPKELQASDLEIMQKYAREKLDNQPENTVLKWSNPQSQNNGEVKLLRSFNNNGRECRVVGHSVDLKGDAEGFRYTSTICKNNKNTWVNLP